MPRIPHKDFVEPFDAKPTEIKAPFSNALDPPRATDLSDKMLAAGLPILTDHSNIDGALSEAMRASSYKAERLRNGGRGAMEQGSQLSAIS